MPLHMDIVPIQRLVVIVARGEVTADDLANNVKDLIAAKVAHYAKIIDVSASIQTPLWTLPARHRSRHVCRSAKIYVLQ